MFPIMFYILLLYKPVPQSCTAVTKRMVIFLYKWLRPQQKLPNLIFVLTPLLFGEWGRLLFCLTSLIVQWPTSFLTIVHDYETGLHTSSFSTDPICFLPYVNCSITCYSSGYKCTHKHMDVLIGLFQFL